MDNLEIKVNEKIDTKKVETALLDGQEISENKIEKSLNYEELTPVEQQAIDEFVKKLDITNTAQLLQFGASAQTNISKFSDQVLAEVKTKDTGAVGDMLSSLYCFSPMFSPTGKVPILAVCVLSG